MSLTKPCRETPAVDRSPTLPEQDRRIQTDEIQRIFNRLARYLTERQRSIFVLREFEGLSMKEIAEIVGCRESTVRNHMFQARVGAQGETETPFPRISAP